MSRLPRPHRPLRRSDGVVISLVAPGLAALAPPRPRDLDGGRPSEVTNGKDWALCVGRAVQCSSTLSYRDF
jgi:hypothetical protein